MINETKQEIEMETSEIKKGTKVIANGYEGTVTRVCEWNTSMIEIRLAAGVLCVDRSNFGGQYKDNYIITI
jgi:preprotein translocase subunit YajC